MNRIRKICPEIFYIIFGAFLILISCDGLQKSAPINRPMVISDDAGWCWFEGPRALIDQDRLVLGTVAAGRNDSLRCGDIEMIVFNLKNGAINLVELYDRLEADDHNSPALLKRPDGRFLTLYARHGSENRFYYHTSEPDDPGRWGRSKFFAPSATTRLTYSNIFLLTAENNRIYNFFRGLDNSFKPSYVYSDDLGESWTTGKVFIQVPAAEKHRPYVRYISNQVNRIHFLYTEGHPRDYSNSLYHLYYEAGMLHASDGTPIARLEQGLNHPEAGTLIFQGQPDQVAWCNDIGLDSNGQPFVAYSVQIDAAELPPGQGGEDLRYRYARWDGQHWQDYPLAFAGSRLYAGEDDYAGLAALTPGHPNVVFVATNAEPISGAPLISQADGRRHHEIFKGVTEDQGSNWQWTPITQNSRHDNLRPIALPWKSGRIVLLWLRGEYRAYTDYAQEAVAMIVPVSP